MYETFGAVPDDPAVEFRLFLPDATVDPHQYVRGGSPRIRSVRVAGDFQAAPWDAASAPELQRSGHENGWLWRTHIEQLADGYYQYKYLVEYDDGTTRWCGDPCSKYGSAQTENSAFVIGGHDTKVRALNQRKPLRDLVIYELMADDFTAEYRGTRAPLDAISDKLDHLARLGVNAVELMPWTAWPGSGFSWGYDPFAFFAVEHRLVHDPHRPLDKLVHLKAIVNELHDRGMHVIMDGVFNHVSAGSDPGNGFAYYWLYRNPGDSPFVGRFGDAAFFQDFDFRNACTSQFIIDVCRYWLDEYKIDGIRFDYVKGFIEEGERADGIGEILFALRDRAAENVSFILELLTDQRYEAIDKTNRVGASGCWFDPLMWESWDAAGSGRARPSLLRALDTGRDFAGDKRPVTYIENHDHSTVTEKLGGRERWWRTQAPAIALFTAAGAPMIHNGQEWGEQYWMPEDGDGRVLPRPLRWAQADDAIGRQLIALYAKLAAIREVHPALRSSNFYPRDEAAEGYGVDEERGIVIFHRWGNDDAGRLERFIIAVNYSPFAQRIDIPFSADGRWDDLLNGVSAEVSGFQLRGHVVPSHWGEIWVKVD
jgi:1,4-alpha-glucan branching enzyme